MSQQQRRVGIGTSTPTAELEVNGRVKTSSFTMTEGASAGRLLMADAAGNARWGGVSQSEGAIVLGIGDAAVLVPGSGKAMYLLLCGRTGCTAPDISYFTVGLLVYRNPSGEVRIQIASQSQAAVYNGIPGMKVSNPDNRLVIPTPCGSYSLQFENPDGNGWMVVNPRDREYSVGGIAFDYFVLNYTSNI